MPKLAAVVSNSLPLWIAAGRSDQRLPRIRPSMDVHMWQITYGFIELLRASGTVIHP
jgi:hypothetical protein